MSSAVAQEQLASCTDPVPESEDLSAPRTLRAVGCGIFKKKTHLLASFVLSLLAATARARMHTLGWVRLWGAILIPMLRVTAAYHEGCRAADGCSLSTVAGGHMTGPGTSVS